MLTGAAAASLGVGNGPRDLASVAEMIWHPGGMRSMSEQLRVVSEGDGRIMAGYRIRFGDKWWHFGEESSPVLAVGR